MSQREEAKKLLADIQSRHEDILKLEESLRELRQLFLDMQTLVESQGEMLNEIENNGTIERCARVSNPSKLNKFVFTQWIKRSTTRTRECKR